AQGTRLWRAYLDQQVTGCDKPSCLSGPIASAGVAVSFSTSPIYNGEKEGTGKGREEDPYHRGDGFPRRRDRPSALGCGAERAPGDGLIRAGMDERRGDRGG